MAEKAHVRRNAKWCWLPQDWDANLLSPRRVGLLFTVQDLLWLSEEKL